MAWEDEDPEEEGGALAVARALAGSEEGDTPEEQPSPEEVTTPAQAPPSSQQADGDEQSYLGANQEQSPTPAQSVSGADDEATYADPQQADAGEQTSAGPDDESSYLSPIKAPSLPNFRPYVDESVNAQKLAEAKHGFDPNAYKPSVARRIAAGFAGFAGGAGSRNPAEGLSVGREITSAPLRHAQAAEAQRESGIQQDMANDRQQNQQIRDANQQDADRYNMEEHDMLNQSRAQQANARATDYAAQAAARRNAPDSNGWQPDDPNNPLGSYHATSVSGQPLKSATAPASVQKSPAYLIAQRRQQGTAQGLTGEDLKSYSLTGKIPTKPNHTSVHIPSAAAQQYNDEKAAFKRENGRDMNAAEIAAWGHQQKGAMSRSLGDKIESQKNQQIESARQIYNKSTRGQADLDDYLDAWQAAQDNYEQRIGDATGADIPHVVIKDNVDDKGNWHGNAPAQPKAAPAQQAPRQQQPPPNAAPVVIQNGGGKQLTDKALAAQYVAKAGGDKAKARQLAQQDGWKF